MVPRQIEVVLRETRTLFDHRQDHRWPRDLVCGIARCDTTGRQSLEGTFVIVQSKTQLASVAAATHTSSSLSGSLNSRQKQSNENTDNGDHNQQFDQCESSGGNQHAGTFHENLSKNK
jgi:hypothetical protein